MANEVELHMYDLSAGCATHVSWLLVGKELDGVWHTSIVVYGREFYFGRDGILDEFPGDTFFGHPPEKIKTMGSTYKSKTEFYDYIEELKTNGFARGEYSLLKNNCNTFTNEVSQFLLGRGIPTEILQLPGDIVKGGLVRASQAAAVGGVVYGAKKLIDSWNKEEEKKVNAGPSWLEIGNAIANTASVGAALSSRKEEDNSRLTLAHGAGSSNYQTNGLLESWNKKSDTGPSWLAVGSAIATMAIAGAAFASAIDEKEKPRNRDMGWRSYNYDSDSE